MTRASKVFECIQLCKELTNRIEKDLAEGEILKVDTGNVVAYAPSISWSGATLIYVPISSPLTSVVYVVSGAKAKL